MDVGYIYSAACLSTHKRSVYRSCILDYRYIKAIMTSLSLSSCLIYPSTFWIYYDLSIFFTYKLAGIAWILNDILNYYRHIIGLILLRIISRLGPSQIQLIPVILYCVFSLSELCSIYFPKTFWTTGQLIAIAIAVAALSRLHSLVNYSGN